jgi:hypothetical protein
MGHLLNHCPLVDDRLQQLLQEEVMNVHQLVLPTTITTVPNVFILGTQTITTTKCGCSSLVLVH